jgi:hypothetical protein
MSKLAKDIINAIPGIENKRYLELGLGRGETFNAVRARSKMSVDIQYSPMFRMSTDEFFAILSENVLFDVIFIDAGHDFANVVHDFNNSVEHLSMGGYILVHDLLPPDESHTARDLCGDGYKLLAYFIEERIDDLRSLYMNDFGLTVFKNPNSNQPLRSAPEERLANYVNMSFELFNNLFNFEALYGKLNPHI